MYMFFSHLAIKFSKNIIIINNAMIVVDNKQLSYGSIYTKNLVKFEIFKTYIEIN